MSQLKVGDSGKTPDGRSFKVIHRWPEDRGPGYTEVRFSDDEKKTFCWDYENPEVTS
jgi:hypothetical protein